MKKRNTSEEITKNILQKVVQHISIIAVIIAAVVMLLLYIGPEITLDLKFFTRFSVAGIILCISIVIIYELWCKSGQDKAKTEKEYVELMKEFNAKSTNMDYETMQQYLDYEEKRRYDVEYDKYSRLIVRDTELLEKIQKDIETSKVAASKLDPSKKQDKKKIKKLLHVSLENIIKISTLKKKIKHLNQKRTNIVIKMPYVKSEEFDYLRYNTTSENFKEYAPHDTARYLNVNRAKRYITAITFALFGINMLSFAGTMGGNLWYAIFMTLLSVISLVMTIISGFTTGYKSISVVSTGVYKTAVEYINKAIVYCERNNKELYYKEPPKYLQEEEVVEVVEEDIQTNIDEPTKPDKTISIS